MVQTPGGIRIDFEGDRWMEDITWMLPTHDFQGQSYQALLLDEGGDGLSVFAREFLNVLQENTSLLWVQDLQVRVTPRVEQASAVVGKEQSPYFGYLASAGHEFGEFFLRAPTRRDFSVGSTQSSPAPAIDLFSAIAQSGSR